MYFDPYQVLGVSQNASDDEIKKAYRTLSRRYHPDANVNNPNKAQAEERFKQVQQAYDEIMKRRKQGSSSSYDDPFASYRSQYQSQSNTPLEFQAAQNYINAGHFEEALNVLNRMESSYRNGMWYYLRAVANASLGNTANAMEDARMATTLEPNNMQYRSFYLRLQNHGSAYSDFGQSYGRSDVMGNDCMESLCRTLCCISLCCPCNGPC